MKHKGILSLIAGLLISGMLMAGPAAAEEVSESGLDWKAGLGYQGMWVGGFLNGISGRAWIEEKFGAELNYFYGDIETRTFNRQTSLGGTYTTTSSKSDADLYVFELKAMYAPVVKEYSRFYVGAVVSRGSFDLKNTGYFGRDFDDKIWGYGLFIGSEWHFQEFPEIGFNFDVGYKAYRYDDRYTDPDDGDYFKMDLDLEGIDATVGIHYYF